MPNQFLSPEGDLENYFVTDYWLIDQYVGDQLWVWGRAFGGKLGNGVTVSTTFISTPITTFAGGTNWKQIGGSGFTNDNNHAAIKTDGTLWTWGYATNGQLGNRVTIGRISTPVTTFAGGTNWKQVSVGETRMAAIKTDGTLWTWGRATYGMLGNGVTVSSAYISTPITTFAGGTNWKQVSAGEQHMAAIKTDGTLWTWGGGSYGQLGNAQITNRSTPVTTFAGGTDWKRVSCGDRHIAAIKTDGTLWIWGRGGDGRLGNAQAAGDRSTPVTTFAGGTNWKQVIAGYRHTAAIKTDGTLWTWGFNLNGHLGNAQTASRSTPVTTFAGGTNWKQVSVGNQHTAAIKTDGTLWTWGRGNYAQLGNAQILGSTTPTSTPITTFAGGTNWKQVACGPNNTAAVQAGINAEYPLS